MEESIVWQPCNLHPVERGVHELKNYGFKINLNWNFAKSMIEKQIEKSVQLKLNEVVAKRYNTLSPQPLIFYENTAFLQNINLGQGGREINVGREEISSLLKNKTREIIEYHTHNIDYLTDAHTLLGLFDTWIQFSEALKKQ